MDKIESIVVGFAQALYCYFLKVPIFVGAIAVLFYTLRHFILKKNTVFFGVWSDFVVILFIFPFWGICAALPGATTKSMANLCELMLLGYLWSGILIVRVILAAYNVVKYKLYAHGGNVLLFVVCAIVSYFFPTLPE